MGMWFWIGLAGGVVIGTAIAAIVIAKLSIYGIRLPWW